MSKRFAKDNSKVFSIRLKQRMFEKDMTQAMLSDLTGLQRQTISLYQRGENVPAADNLAIIAETLECSTDWLLGLTDYTQKDIEGTTLESIGLSEKAARKLQEAMADEKTAKWANFFFSSNFPKNIATTMAQYSCARFASGVYELYNRTKDDTILTQNGFNQAVSDLFGEKTLLGMSEPEKELSFNMFRAITSDYDSNLIGKLIRGFGGSLGLTRLYELQAEQLMRNLLMWSLNEAMTTYYKMELDRLETE